MCTCFSLSFFFSSRRRHTRCLSDWSSDVCSSDLGVIDARAGKFPAVTWITPRFELSDHPPTSSAFTHKIGRASCRERVYISVVAVYVKKKKSDQRLVTRTPSQSLRIY